MEGTTDDNGAMPPMGQLTLEPTHTEDIGRQLVNMEYIQQEIKQHIQRLEDNDDRATAFELSFILPKLDGVQRSLRKTFDAHARPLIRKLHIFHLPDELLMKIFEEAKTHSDSTLGWGWGEHTSPVNETIRSLRLTCRRFCNASSHLLLDSLNVSLTYSSLERLDEVSRHPTIAKGIRSLQINAALSSPVLTSSLQDFVELVSGLLLEENGTSFDRMERCLDGSAENHGWNSRSSSPGLQYDMGQHVSNLRSRNLVLLSCMNYLRNGVFDQDEDEIMVTLSKVFTQYNQLYDDQTALLQNNTFARNVAEAAARLPKLIELSITDFKGCDLSTFPTELLVPVYNSVRKKLLRPLQWTPAMDSMLPEKPSKLLYQLPEACLHAGIPVTQLTISLTSGNGHDLGLSEAQAEDMVTTAGTLEVLTIDCRFTLQEIRPKTSSESQASSSRFASLLLNSTNLKSVTLRFDRAWMTPDPSMDLNAGPLLAALPWGRLKRFVLVRAYIHGDELSEHLEKLSPGTYIRLYSVHLLTGLWVDLLDVIREKADCNSGVIDARGSQNEWLDFVFEDDTWDAPHINRANQYIRGQISENPLRTPPAQDDTNQDQPNGGWPGGDD